MKWIGTQTIYNDVRVRGDVNVERLVKITNTNTSSASEGGKLTLISNDGAALGDDHQLGRVAFQAAEDSSSTIRQGASIEAYADAAWSASENGTRLEFYINDGNNSIEKVLTLDSDRLATFAGAVTVTGALTGTLATATQPNIESIGTDGDSLHILADQLIMSNTSTDTPVINLVNTTDDDQAGQLIFEKLRDDDAVASGQNLGEIWFRGQDSAQNTEDYAVIIGEIDVSTSGQESGKLNFHVAGHDGSTRTAMTLTGGSEGTEVDATIGLGANSVVTIPGAIQPATVIASAYLDADTAHLSGAQTFTGTKTLNSFKGTAGATVTNILDEDAMGSNSATALATQQSIKAYVDVNKITHYQVQGYATGGTGGDYVISKNIGSNLAPFLHNVSTGSDGLDAKSVAVWLRTGGHVMPNNCTLTRFTGWTASQGSASQTIALFRVRLADDSDTDPSAVLLQEITYTASGNQTADLFNETAASGSRDAALLDMEAGDIIFPAIKGAGNPIYFNGTFEVIPR